MKWIDLSGAWNFSHTVCVTATFEFRGDEFFHHLPGDFRGYVTGGNAQYIGIVM
jgi:hypothetical protein